jgi:RimJ/RimL family protein N-acetyltransferase
MIQLEPSEAAILRDWYLPDRPGPLVGLHVIKTGNGVIFADRWPEPRALLAHSAGNYSLTGDPTVLSPDNLRHLITGFLDAPVRFDPIIRDVFPDARIWDRVISSLDCPPPPHPVGPHRVRRLAPSDSDHVGSLSSENGWIMNTWGGPAGLAGSDRAWGAFAGDKLVSVACTFFLGERYEEIGVVTEPAFRGLDLGAACATALCHDILSHGRWPSWSTSPGNFASLRLAEKLGFKRRRHDRLFVIGVAVPGTE